MTADMLRRQYLALVAVGGSSLTAGCFGWFGDDSDNDTDSDGEDGDAGESGADESTDNTGEDGSSDTDDQQHSDRNESTENGDESRDDDASAGENESSESDEDDGEENEVHDESELHPDENETVHQGEYDENASGQQRGVVSRPASDVEIADESARQNGSGGVTMTVTVRNVSNEPIDVVELYVDYTVGGEYVYGDTASVTDLAAGASKEAVSTAPRERVGGVDPEALGVEIVDMMVYDYAG